jgi:hypothetical protein
VSQNSTEDVENLQRHGGVPIYDRTEAGMDSNAKRHAARNESALEPQNSRFPDERWENRVN